MLEFYFDKEQAIDRLRYISRDFAVEYSLKHQKKGEPWYPTVATIPDYCKDYSTYEVANYTFYE